MRAMKTSGAFAGKKVLIMGLGLHGGGVGSARFFAKAGAKVTVTDLKEARTLALSLEKLKGLDIDFVLGEHREENFRNADLIIKNPAVRDDSSYLATARRAGAPIETDISFFFNHTPAFTIGVTGTKGKSTTTALIAHILKAFGTDAHATWLPGTSVFDTLSVCTKSSVAVVELASFEIESLAPLKISPHVAVLTNIFPDHLNWHGSFERYQEAKISLFSYQRAHDRAVINLDDSVSSMLISKIVSQPFFYSAQCREKEILCGACITKGTIVVKAPSFTKELRLADCNTKLVGAHNFHNILAALAAVAAALSHRAFPAKGAFDEKIVIAALTSFIPLPGRFERVAEIRGVEFINDTAATNPGAVGAVLEAIVKEKPVVLIAGGEDKDLPYGQLAGVIAKRAKAIFLFSGSASEKLAKALAREGTHIPVYSGFIRMEDIVVAAFESSVPGDTILLSPGAASFNHFAHEFARGEAFVNAVTKLKKRYGTTRAR